MKPNISDVYIYIYQIEPREETSWYLPLSSLSDDWGERNNLSKVRVRRTSISSQFFVESSISRGWISLPTAWGTSSCHERTEKRPNDARNSNEAPRPHCSTRLVVCHLGYRWSAPWCLRTSLSCLVDACCMREPLSSSSLWVVREWMERDIVR